MGNIIFIILINLIPIVFILNLYKKHNQYLNHVQMGLKYKENNMLDEAILEFKNAIEINAHEATCYYHLGYLIYEKYQNKNSKAIDIALETIEKAIALNPNLDEAYYTIGYIYTHSKNNNEKAEKYLKKASDINPTIPNYYNTIGIVNIKNNKWEIAINQLEKGLSINTQNTSIMSNLAISYYNSGQAEKAMRLFENIITIKPDYNTYNNYGNILGELGNIEKAVSQFKKSIELNPYDPFSHYWLGCLYMMKQDPENAIFELKRSINFDINFGKAYYILAQAYEAIERQKEAKEAMDTALILEPNLGKDLM